MPGKNPLHHHLILEEISLPFSNVLGIVVSVNEFPRIRHCPTDLSEAVRIILSISVVLLQEAPSTVNAIIKSFFMIFNFVIGFKVVFTVTVLPAGTVNVNKDRNACNKSTHKCSVFKVPTRKDSGQKR